MMRGMTLSRIPGCVLAALIFATIVLAAPAIRAQTAAPPAGPAPPTAYPYLPPPNGYPPPPNGYPPPPNGYPPPPPGATYPYPSPGYPYPLPRYLAPPDPPASATHVGLGYKIGNGLGFVGGDLIVSPAAHVALDLQANWFRVSTSTGRANGYGLAPGLQLYLRQPGVSTPYLSLGYIYATLALNDVRATLQGGFANAGYEWKWSNGLAILVGGGASRVASARATDGFTTVDYAGGWFLNIEAGLRFMIF
jgi:hypothetical protein